MDIFSQKINTTELRKCQREAYLKITDHYSKSSTDRSALIQLPTGTGKSALIAIFPFGLAKKKILILTPSVKLAKQIEADLDIIKNESGNIYKRFSLLEDTVLSSLELYVLRLEGTVNQSDIQEHQILIANYQQLQDLEKWFKTEKDAVDLIIIDEAHHQEANTYQEIINFFDKSKIIGLTATPFRSDGKKVEGNIIYKYHFHEAIKDGVIRNIKIVNVSPKEVELSFTDDGSQTYTLEQILELKEEAWFNKGIALSPDCCNSIAQKAKEKLEELKSEFPNSKHQIIAAAISKRHAREYVKPAFERLGLSVGMVSSDPQDKITNDKTFEDLKYGRIEVIIHIGMLGEGFDHPPLGVAAIFRPYKSLNPYIQFLGRVLRRNDETSHCFVVSHIGLNQIKRFQEFKMFDYEDQKFLEELFAENTEDSFISDSEKGREKVASAGNDEQLSIREIGDDVVNFESQFLSPEKEVNTLIGQVEQLSPEQKKLFFEKFGIDVKDTKVVLGKKTNRVKPVDKRKASRNLLNEKEKSITVDILKELSLKTHNRDFNPLYTNLVWVKKKVSKEVNKKLNIKNNQRKTIDNQSFENAEQSGLLKDVEKECLDYFRGKLANK
jgi:superfamily II DNA or RNA helicase